MKKSLKLIILLFLPILSFSQNLDVEGSAKMGTDFSDTLGVLSTANFWSLATFRKQVSFRQLVKFSGKVQTVDRVEFTPGSSGTGGVLFDEVTPIFDAGGTMHKGNFIFNQLGGESIFHRKVTLEEGIYIGTSVTQTCDEKGKIYYDNATDRVRVCTPDPNNPGNLIWRSLNYE